MNQDQVKALFLLAGLEAQGLYELANRYWPDVPEYAELRRQSPWWLVKTPAGLIEIGWRKRVIEIDWHDTPIRILITNDEVTRDETMVHAWSYVKALEYLTALGRAYRAGQSVSTEDEITAPTRRQPDAPAN